MIAGRRLLADVRSPGRVAAVLFASGAALVLTVQLAVLIIVDSTRPDGEWLDDTGFYLSGYGGATAVGVTAALIATSSLAVMATEQVLDNRRGTAVLVALAASPDLVGRIVRRQLLLAAVPPALVGAGLAVPVSGWMLVAEQLGGWVTVLGAGVAVALVAVTATGGALLAARAVRPAVGDSSGPENLRAP